MKFGKRTAEKKPLQDRAGGRQIVSVMGERISVLGVGKWRLLRLCTPAKAGVQSLRAPAWAD